IIFLVSGLWHGANWTFILWGALNVLYFLPFLLSGNHLENLDIVAQGKRVQSLKDLLKMVITFNLISFSLIFFRSRSIGNAIDYTRQMFIGIFHLSSYKETWN